MVGNEAVSKGITSITEEVINPNSKPKRPPEIPIISDSVIKSLNGAGVSPGYVLTNTFSKTYVNINGGGMYLVFAWPSVFGTPSFVVNGLLSTAFTKVRGVSNLNSFTNELGFTSNYDVWVSNTAQNSPLTIIIS